MIKNVINLFNPISHTLKKRKDNRKILPYYLKKINDFWRHQIKPTNYQHVKKKAFLWKKWLNKLNYY
jgi:hypothetical protein